jgi:CsoR family transcriptional regulator, copper-sensing transcriptional repressor
MMLAFYTPLGYGVNMQEKIKGTCLKRLNRIEGQVRGISGMIADDRYCIDVITQIAAVRAALNKVEEEILRDHVEHCVEHAILSGDKVEQRKKVSELLDVLGRAGK